MRRIIGCVRLHSFCKGLGAEVFLQPRCSLPARLSRSPSWFVLVCPLGFPGPFLDYGSSARPALKKSLMGRALQPARLSRSFSWIGLVDPIRGSVLRVALVFGDGHGDSRQEDQFSQVRLILVQCLLSALLMVQCASRASFPRFDFFPGAMRKEGQFSQVRPRRGARFCCFVD